jgi:uncharacterized oligopeptide transporter (OPT) family protein
MAIPTDAPLPPTPPSAIPALSPDATPEEKDAHWLRYVYQGDKMPQLTLRAVLMGGILGMAMSASNLYTTLSIGWAFGVAITACVLSFVSWNIFRYLSGTVLAIIAAVMGGLAMALSGTLLLIANTLALPAALGIISGGVLVGIAIYTLLRRKLTDMSILENACMASTASAAGYSTGSTVATMFGALVLLAPIPEGKTAETMYTWEITPPWVLTIFTLCTGLMGVFLAIPMKRQMINHEQLPFPSGIAAAETLRSLYSKSAEAVGKAYILVAGLLAGALLGFLRTSEGTLKYIDELFRVVPLRIIEAIDLPMPRLYPDWTNPKTGETAMARPGGFQFDTSVLLIAAGMIVGLRISLSLVVSSAILYFAVGPWLSSMDVANAGNPDYIQNLPIGGPTFSIRNWSLWGGTAVMVFASLTSVALQWRTVARAFMGSKPGTASGTDDAIEVPGMWMILGMAPITIAMVIVQIVAFDISWWSGLIAVAMSFVLSLVASRATGETDTTPIGAMGKVMQLMFAVFHPGQIVPNLASAGIAANSASSSADLLMDLKTGYLLGANPRKQFLAQFVGVFFGTVAIVPIWYLMVPTKAALEKFALPATRQWEAVAKVLTAGIDQLPISARWALVIGALVGVALPLIEKVLVPKKLKPFFPSATGIGLAWVLPFSNAFSFAIGAFIAWIWTLINRRNSETYTIPLASGLVAGEAMMMAFIAIIATIIGLANL